MTPGTRQEIPYSKSSFGVVSEFTARRARELGEDAGIAAATRLNKDIESFEDAPNPFGMDSEPDFCDAGQDAYEDAFEANR